MNDPRTEKAKLADDLEALRLMVSEAPKPICDIAGDTLTRAISAVEAHMPDGEVETFEMWAVQRKGVEGWRIANARDLWETNKFAKLSADMRTGKSGIPHRPVRVTVTTGEQT
jgi:hypothetical protein